ncbi:MAG: LPS export ABC transporter periplasmic protein LptC [bacterium]
MKLILLMIALFQFQLHCNKETEESPIKIDSRTPDQKIEDFTLTETYKGNEEWRLVADCADVYEQMKVAKAVNITIEFYEKGKRSSILTADWGTIDLGSNDMVAYNNVIVISSDGTKLETSKLRWDAFDAHIRSDEKVRFTKNESIIYGVGFESDPNLENFKTTRMVGHLTNEEVSIYSEGE